MSTDDGATPADKKPNDCPDTNGIMHPHAWQWIWVNGVMTDRVRCVNCNKEQLNVAEKAGRVLGH